MANKFSKFAAGLGRRGSGHEEGGNNGQEQSLTTILPTHEDRTNLVLLIADCTEVMRKQVLNTFDPNSVDNSEEAILASSNQHQQKSTSADIQNAPKETSNASPEDDKSEEEAKKKAEDEYERRVKELKSPQMQELKQAAENHFDAWRDKVIQRVGEVVNHPDNESSASSDSANGKQNSLDSHAGENPVDEKEVEALRKLYPPTATPLRALIQSKRILILHSLLLLLLSLESYPAESRVLLLYLTSSLGLPLKLLTDDESKVARGLLDAAQQQMNADEETKKKAEAGSSSRKWKVGLGAAAGAVLIGVTGGLAAPLLAAGVGTVMGGIGLGATATAGYLGALAGSAPLVGALFGAYGGRMTGKMVDSYAREVEDFAFLPVRKKGLIHTAGAEKNNRRLRVAIGISGWLTEEAEVVKPWQVIGESTEAFALRWELKALLALGNSLTTYIKSAAWSWAKKEIISRTIFAAFASALVLPYGMAKAARVIDNPFSVARNRSDKAGKVLADALINKVQGERPVTLVGYSLGARVIYSCLDELANRNAFGLVESAVLAGAATPSDSIAWRRLRSVVTGRLVNVYSTNDYLLSFLYRTSSLQYGIAGLQAVEGVNGIENVDVSELVDGHLQYRFVTGKVLQRIDLEDIDASEVEKQVRQLELQEIEDDEERKRREAEGKSPEDESEEMEKEVEKKNKASQALDWVSGKLSGISVGGSSSETPKQEQQKPTNVQPQA